MWGTRRRARTSWRAERWTEVEDNLASDDGDTLGAWEEGAWSRDRVRMEVGGGVILGMPGRASATVPHQVLAEDNQLLSDTSSRRRSRSQVGGWNLEAGTHGRHLGLKHKFGNHQHVDACKPIGTDEIMQAEGSERQLLGPALSK